MFFRIMPGRLPDFSVAPTMATEEGLKNVSIMMALKRVQLSDLTEDFDIFCNTLQKRVVFTG